MWWASALWLGCGSPATGLTGTLRDGIDGQPLSASALEIIAIANEATTPGCEQQQTTVDSAGRFVLSGLCLDVTSYRLSLSDEGYWLPDHQRVERAATGDVNAWPAPEAGVWRRSGRATERVPATAGLHEERTRDGTVVVAPDTMPVDIPPLADGDWWMLSGPAADRLPEPLIAAGPVRFVGSDGDAHPYGPWWYLSTRFRDDGRASPETWRPNDGEVIDKRGDGRTIRYIPATALPEGLWAIRDGTAVAIAQRRAAR